MKKLDSARCPRFGDNKTQQRYSSLVAFIQETRFAVKICLEVDSSGIKTNSIGILEVFDLQLVPKGTIFAKNSKYIERQQAPALAKRD